YSSDITDLGRQISGHKIDIIGKVLPGARYAFNLGLATELAFGADFARDTRDFRGEGSELVHHRVDRVLQLKKLATDVDRNLLGQIAVGDGRGHGRNIPDLRSQIGRHQIDVISEIFPRASNALYCCLSTELAFGAHLTGNAVNL